MKKAEFHILLIDNYDSFTYNLYDYFLQLGVACTVVRNDEWAFEAYKTFDFDGLVLSPGPQRPVDAGLLIPILKYFYTKKPILGICLGHQAIGELSGANLVKATLPMHGKTTTIHHTREGIFKNLPPSYEVMRYHSLLLENIEHTPLEATAYSPIGEIMALKHNFLPIFGVQFHPESILTEYGLELLKNWINIARDIRLSK